MGKNSIKNKTGLSIGNKVADSSGIDQVGNKIKLSKLLKKGKVIVIFYIGQWRPVCLPHLKKLQEGLMNIYVKGASVLLVTPENQENIHKTFLKTNITIPILYDENYKIMKLFGVDFIPTLKERILYNNFLQANLKEAQSDQSQTIPIPATFIINSDFSIRWKHFDHNYKKRASVEEIINYL